MVPYMVEPGARDNRPPLDAHGSQQQRSLDPSGAGVGSSSCLGRHLVSTISTASTIILVGTGELKIPKAGRFNTDGRRDFLKKATSSGRFLDGARNDVLYFWNLEFTSIPEEYI